MASTLTKAEIESLNSYSCFLYRSKGSENWFQKYKSSVGTLASWAHVDVQYVF